MVMQNTPPMGWNSWNSFGPEIGEAIVKESAEALLDTGLAELGYRYVNVDDFWQSEKRIDGRLRWDDETFPSGIPALADTLHRKGLKLGLYSCAGPMTCGGRPGSYGHERIDAETFAEWGVDLLKYDYCHLPPGVDGRRLCERMGRELAASGRSIVYSLCEWGRGDPWEWAAYAGATMWRISGDIDDRWESIVDVGFSRLSELAPYAGRGRWNDPDTLVVGMHGVGNREVADGVGCTDAEYRSHFLLWCLTAAPLLIGADVRNLDEQSLTLLSNPAAVAVNQDPLGVPARRIGRVEHGGETAEVWARPLSGGRTAVGVFNMGLNAGRRVPVAWESLGWDARTTFSVRDALGGGEDIRRSDVSVAVGSHDAALLILEPVD